MNRVSEITADWSVTINDFDIGKFITSGHLEENNLDSDRSSWELLVNIDPKFKKQIKDLPQNYACSRASVSLVLRKYRDRGVSDSNPLISGTGLLQSKMVPDCSDPKTITLQVGQMGKLDRSSQLQV